MAKIRVTPEELGAASQQLGTLSEQYTAIYTNLLQQAGTMGEAWDGADNLAYVEQINSLCQDLKNMAQSLQVASEVLKQQQSNYASHQESNISQVRKLKN